MSFRSKVDVDRYAEDIHRQCKSDHDRKMKAVNIGKQYLNVKAYDSAVRYFTMFLSVNENSPNTYKLLGKCFQQMGKVEKAISAYKRSLELEPEQPAITLQICDLIGQTNISNVGISVARYWCERGSDLFPRDPIICNLKQKIIMVEDKDPKALETFYLSELKSNPDDENVLIKLLTLYADTKQFFVAHKKVLECQGRSNLRHSLEWYRCLSKVYKFCLEEGACSEDQTDYFLEAAAINDNYLSILHRTRDSTLFDEALSALLLLDQILWKVCSLPNLKNAIDKDIKKHFLAQLAYHIVVIYLKKLSQDHSAQSGAMHLSIPALMFAQASSFDLESPHLSSLDPRYKTKMKYLVDDAIFRVIQSNLTLRTWSAATPVKELVSQAVHSYSKETRQQLYTKIFSNSKVSQTGNSCWLTVNYFEKLPARLLSIDEIITESTLYSYERRSWSSFHDMVWLGTQALLLNISRETKPILPQLFNCQTFPSRPVTSQNLNLVDIESLSKLDIDSFLCLSVFTTYLQLKQISNGMPTLLLADAMYLLPTDKQCKFWTAAQKLQKNELISDPTDLKSVLIKGIETVRLIGNHGLDLELLISVARTLRIQAKSALKEHDALYASAIENRAYLYWKNITDILESLLQDQHYERSSNVLFSFNSNFHIRSSDEIYEALEEGRFFIAYKMMRNEDYHNAIAAFKLINSPSAALNEAVIYKRLAFTEIKGLSKDEITSEKRAKHNMWLMKAKEVLEGVSERIRGDPHHPLFSELETEMEEIEGRLTRYEKESDVDSLPSSISSSDDIDSDSSYPIRTNLPSSFHNFDRGHKTKKSSKFSKPYSENCDLKDLIVAHTATLKITEKLAKKVEKLESDVAGFLKDVQKTDRNVEQILSHVRSNPVANPNVLRDMQTQLSNLCYQFNPAFQPPLFQTPNFCQPSASLPSMIPGAFLPPGFSPFLHPGLPLIPPVPLPPFANPYGSMQAPPMNGQIPSQPSSSSVTLPQHSLANSSNPSGLDLPGVSGLTYSVQQSYQSSQPSSATIESQQPPMSNSNSLSVSHSRTSSNFTSLPSTFNLHQPLVSQPAGQVQVSGSNLPSSQPSIPPTFTASSTLNWQNSYPSTPQNQRIAHKLNSFEPSASSTPPANQLFSSKPPLFTPNDMSTPVKTTMPTITTSSSQPIITTSKISTDEINKSKVSEPLFNLLTKPSLQSNLSNNSSDTQNHPAKPTTTVTSLFGITSQPTSVHATSTAEGTRSTFAFSTNKTESVKPAVFGGSESVKPAVFGGSESVTSSVFTRSETLLNSSPSTPVISKPEIAPKSLLKETLLKSVDISTNSSFQSANGPSFLGNSSSLNFASFASTPPSDHFKKSDSFKGFQGQGSKLFGSLNANTAPDHSSEVNNGESVEEFEPTQEFQPVIEMPDLIEVKTGEEDLTVLYEERCKLLRFDSKSQPKEWKERGIGKMKILYDPVKGAVRLLMRREQVHKVCCNQYLLKDLELKPVYASDKAWSWSNVDFSEGEEKLETFALRFKNSELANAFYSAFEDAKTKITNSPRKGSSQDSKLESSTNNKNQSAPLAELFKPEIGSWECKSCYTRNGKEKSKCLACEASNPNQPALASATSQKSTPLSELFKPESGSWECKSCYTRNGKEKSKCLACEEPNPNQPALALAAPQKSNSLGPSVIQLGSNTSSFSFGIPPSFSNKDTSATASSIEKNDKSSKTNGAQSGLITNNFMFGVPQPERNGI